MKANPPLKYSILLGLGITLAGIALPPNAERIKLPSGTASIFVLPASAQTNTSLTIFKALKAESTNTGGNEGLVNEKTSLATAWKNLAAASDAKKSATDATLISDGKGNYYKNYIASSTETFAGKGYNLVGSIQLSSGPDSIAPTKVRFTKP
jgi:hypothetical protein